jgi:hypothetical protein
MAKDFAERLSSYLDIGQEEVSFEERWSISSPSDANGGSLPEFIVKVRGDEIRSKCANHYQASGDLFYDFYHAFDGFRDSYREKEHKHAYVSPPVQRNWLVFFLFLLSLVQGVTDGSKRNLASRVTKSDRDDAVKRLKVYRDWFMEHVVSARTDHTLIIVPIENLSPRYRDESPK